MITRLTENKPDSRSEACWGEIRAYPSQPTSNDGTEQLPLTCQHRAFATRPRSCTWTKDPLSNGSNVDMNSCMLTSFPTSVKSPKRLYERRQSHGFHWHRAFAYHRFAAVPPSRISVPRLNHTPSELGSLSVNVVEFTVSRNRLATEHICQCSGIDAGGSAIRVLTGVRSPGKTQTRVRWMQSPIQQNELATHHASRRRGLARGRVLGVLVGILRRLMALLPACVSCMTRD